MLDSSAIPDPIFVGLHEHISKPRNVMQKRNLPIGARVAATAEACSDALQVQSNCTWNIIVLAFETCATDCVFNKLTTMALHSVLWKLEFIEDDSTEQRYVEHFTWCIFWVMETVVLGRLLHLIICCMKGCNKIHKMLLLAAVLPSKALVHLTSSSYARNVLTIAAYTQALVVFNAHMKNKLPEKKLSRAMQRF